VNGKTPRHGKAKGKAIDTNTGESPGHQKAQDTQSQSQGPGTHPVGK